MPEPIITAPGDVRDAVKAYMTGDRYLTGWDTPLTIAKEMGLRENYSYTEGWNRAAYKAQQRFDGQVNRAFNALAEAGVIRKAKAGYPGPGGSKREIHKARFYTHEAWSRMEAEELARQAAELDEFRRWEAVWDALVAAGYPAESVSGYYRASGRGYQVTLQLQDWERLVRDHLEGGEK